MEFLITRLLNDLYQEIQTQHVINVEELNKNRISKILKSAIDNSIIFLVKEDVKAP